VRTRVLTTAAALSALAVSVATCSSGGSSSSSPPSSATGSPSGSPSAQQYANGQTATVVLASDPGSLDPDLTSLSEALQADFFPYDSLISFSPSGKVEAGLASSWSGTATAATFTIRKGVTCSDGSALTASDVAANINFIGNVKNASPRLGVWVEPGTTESWSTGGRT
jgi:peptide/nickel transport system substrate-binding protein